MIVRYVERRCEAIWVLARGREFSEKLQKGQEERVETRGQLQRTARGRVWKDTAAERPGQ